MSGHTWAPVGPTGRLHRCTRCDRWKTETPLPSGHRWVRLTGGGAPPVDIFSDAEAEAFASTSRFIEASLDVEVVPGHQSVCFASERQEKRGPK